VTLDHAPLPVGLPELFNAHFQWTAEGIEPSLSGCRPDVFPLDDGPVVSFSRTVLREGFEPSSSGFGGQCSSNRAAATTWFAQRTLRRVRFAQAPNDPGRIRTCTKLVLSQPPLPLGYWTYVFSYLRKSLSSASSAATLPIAPSRTRTRITPVKSRRLCL
jgi:hypothetical protein